MRRGIPLIAAFLLTGCLPHYRHPEALARERDKVEAEAEQSPADPRPPKALYAIYLDMAEQVTVEEPTLLLAEKLHAGMDARKRGKAGTCCLGGLAFAADLLVVLPLRALRTVVTMPMAWASAAHYRRRAESNLERWQALEKSP